MPKLFFPQDLPVVLEDEPKTQWPGPMAASLSLRTFVVEGGSKGGATFTEDATARRSVQWPSSWLDCRRVVTGTAGWLEEEEAKTAPTLVALPPLVQVPWIG